MKRMGTKHSVRAACGLLGLFAGLCAIFALVVTLAEGWQEHAQAQWPGVTARVQSCGIEVERSEGASYWIDCRITYRVADEEIAAHVSSRSIEAPSRFSWQYPSAQIGDMQEWVDAHPQGTPMAVRYDPAKHKKAVLVATDMPLGGPRTPANLRLLGAFALGCVVLLTLAKVVS